MPAVRDGQQQAAQPAAGDRQHFHMMPRAGWINDPNGPLLYKDRYHLFYQHVPGSACWEWGLSWGHAVSKDLVHWRHLPVAISPTPGALDQDGCFSGCATLDENGVPAILYTGVVRKAPGTYGSDVSPQHEFQLLARPAKPEDPDLTEWVTDPYTPFLPAPKFDRSTAAGGAVCGTAADAAALGAAADGLTGWRDPFAVARRGDAASDDDSHFYAIVGAGERGAAGTALLYRTRSIHSGWEYVSELCRDPACRMLECPLLLPVPPLPPRLAGGGNGAANGGACKAGGPQPHVFCYSPDYCATVSEYVVAPFAAGPGATVDLAAAGPTSRMDLGNIFYAPNTLHDKQGRAVLWAWMQEHHRPPGAHDHACCLSAPRCLWLAPAAADGARLRLWQEPLPELSDLRRRGPRGKWEWASSSDAAAATAATHSSAAAAGAGAQCGTALAPGLRAAHLDLELEVARGGSTAKGGAFAVALRPLAPGGEGAAVVFSWDMGALQVVHSTDPAALTAAARDPPPPRGRLCGFPQAAAAAAPPASPPPPPAAAAGRDADAADEDACCCAAAAAAGAACGVCRTPSALDAAPSAAESAGEPAAAAAPRPRRCGGRLEWLAADAPTLGLRLLLDGSLLEVFTSTGEVLSTRVYRTGPPNGDHAAATAAAAAADGGPALELMLLGGGGGDAEARGGCRIVRAAAWEVEPIWPPEEPPLGGGCGDTAPAAAKIAERRDAATVVEAA